MKKFLKIFGLIIVILVSLSVLLLFLYPSYSSDQQKIIKAFGPPDYFEITYNVDDEPMMETWKYVEIGKVFMFVDKNFVETIPFEFSEANSSSALLNAPIEPSDIYYLTNIDELTNKLGIQPEVSELNSELMENAKLYNFGNLVQAGVWNDKIVYVKTFTYAVPKEDDVSEKAVPEEEKNTGELYTNETFGFSLEIPESWKNNYEIQEDYDLALGKFYLTFKYLVPSPYADGVQGYVDVFIIEAYFEEPAPEEIMFSEFLGNNNIYFLYYSHFNGDIAPLDNPIWEFQDIIKSIEIFPAQVG